MGPAHRSNLTVGGRKEKPMTPESPTCLGIKPLCMPDQSLTCEAPFWDFLEMGGNTKREATRLLPQCREGFIAVDTEYGLHPDFPSWFLHICLSYPWGQV